MLILIVGDNGNMLCVAWGKHKGACKTGVSFSEDSLSKFSKVTIHDKEFDDELGIKIDKMERYCQYSDCASELAFSGKNCENITRTSSVMFHSEDSKELFSLETILELRTAQDCECK